MINLILLGLPGAGKGTASESIVDKYHLAHISTGDMFREAMANKTPVGLEAKSYIDKGDLVPDEVTAKLVEERLKQPDTKNGFILDGFPRTTVQAELLEGITKRLEKPLTNVIAIDVDEDVLIKRLSARYICKNCGATYNKISNPTKVEGTCDRCFYSGESAEFCSGDRGRCIQKKYCNCPFVSNCGTVVCRKRNAVYHQWIKYHLSRKRNP